MAPFDEEVDHDAECQDGGYGWVCVACCFAVNALSWGVVASYGVYLAFYLSNNVFEDGTSDDYAFIGGLNFAAAMAVTPVVSIMSKRLGARMPMFVGAGLLGCGFVAASFSRRILHLYLSQGVLVGVGVGFLYLPSINILPQWFTQRRSLASAISSAGSGIGGLIFSLATGVMIRRLSLPWALRIIGIIATVGNLLAVLLIKDRDQVFKPDYTLFDVSLLEQFNVWLLLIWEFIMLFGYITIQFSLSDFALSIGLSKSESDMVTAVLNIGTACGRPFIGFVSDKYGRVRVSSLLTLFTGVICFVVWIPATIYGVLLFFAILIGGIYGVFWAAIGPLSAEIVGMKKLPSMLSLAWLVAIPPAAIAEFLALKLRRLESGRPYLYAQIFAALSFSIASLVLWIVEYRMNRGRTRYGATD